MRVVVVILGDEQVQFTFKLHPDVALDRDEQFNVF
jgi:hypothetical protein